MNAGSGGGGSRRIGGRFGGAVMVCHAPGSTVKLNAHVLVWSLEAALVKVEESWQVIRSRLIIL